MKTTIQIYLYGSWASAGLCQLIAEDKGLSNTLMSAVLSWGGFAARIAAAFLDR